MSRRTDRLDEQFREEIEGPSREQPRQHHARHDYR